jgi:hypothetical protein
MTKYLIEGDIDFYKLLMDEVKDTKIDLEKEQDTKNINNNIDNLCLITNELLVDKFVKLECGHCFNYIPLWHEVYNQKFKYSHYKDSTKILSVKDSIRCPYCRNHQNSLLPFYADSNYRLTYGVTSSDEQYKMIFIDNKFIYTNTIHYFNGQCNYIYEDENQSLCINTHVLMNEELNKTYCCKHFSLMKHKHLKEKKLKIKEELKQQKIKIKEELKQHKIKEKEELKQQKIKGKALQKINLNEMLNNDENIIIGSNTIEKEIILKLDKCQSILKTGPNKGNQCTNNICKDNLCKRHLINSK